MTGMRRSIGLAVALAAALASATPAAARSLSRFGRCLDREGAIVYGTSWCPHCTAQRELLGAAMPYVHYVECSVDGGRRTTEECRAAGVRSFSTWEFGGGSRAHGRLSLKELAARTGCEL